MDAVTRQEANLVAPSTRRASDHGARAPVRPGGAGDEGPFIGVGNPVLKGPPGSLRGLPITALFDDALADVAGVRQLLPLPETANELRAIAKTLGAGDDALLLGRNATGTVVRSLDLSNNRIVAFANHGLLAGEIEGTGEPAPVLTPPYGGSSGGSTGCRRSRLAAR
jgi:hypothetical protein